MKSWVDVVLLSVGRRVRDSTCNTVCKNWFSGDLIICSDVFFFFSGLIGDVTDTLNYSKRQLTN